VAQAPEHHQVLAARENLIHGGVLPGQPDAGAHLVRLAGHVEPGDLGPPGIGAQQGRKHPDDGGLARPVRSQQAMHSALRGDHAEPVERGHFPIALAEVLAHDGRSVQDANLNSLQCM
jgi:hypothetical protein